MAIALPAAAAFFHNNKQRMQVIHERQTYQDELLVRHLTSFLGDTDPAAIEALRSQLEWIEIGSGETLMEQGDPGDSMYLAISGRLRAYKTWRPIEQATMSYGYGLSASLFQLAQAYSVFARDGQVVPISMLKRDERASGVQVMRPEHAQALRQMLHMAAGPGGTAPKAQTIGYSVGGKTGTAHKQEGKGYASNKYRSWFVGLAPIDKPRIVVAVMVDEPSKGVYYGGLVAAPVFSQVVQQTLEDGGIPVLLGYSLGKAQEILCALATAGYPIMLHKAVYEMTEAVKSLLGHLPDYQLFDASTAKGHVLIFPPSHGKSLVLKKLKTCRTAMFSGWAMQPGAKYRYQVDEVFPLSDHADYPELLETVDVVNPRRVYLVHGYTQQFAADLRARGVEAWTLRGEIVRVARQDRVPADDEATAGYTLLNLSLTRPVRR